MPYDARPVSEGGNRGIEQQFSRKAPPGMFRVVSVDTFDGTDGVDGDYPTLDEAKRVALENGGEMLKTHVYDDAGKHLFEAGSF